MISLLGGIEQTLLSHTPQRTVHEILISYGSDIFSIQKVRIEVHFRNKNLTLMFEENKSFLFFMLYTFYFTLNYLRFMCTLKLN